MEALVLIFWAYNKKYLHRLTMPEIIKFQDEIYDYAEGKNPNLFKILSERKKKDEEIEKGVNEVLDAYVQEVEDNRVSDDAGTSGDKEGEESDQDEEDDDKILSNIGKDVLDEATNKKKKK